MLFLHLLRGSCDFWLFFPADKIYDTDRFANVEPPLYPRDESHLVMMDNPCTVLLDSISKDLVENFGIHIHEGYWSVIILFVGVFAWFGDQGNTGLIE